MQTQTPLILVIGLVAGLAAGFGLSELLRDPASSAGGIDTAAAWDEVDSDAPTVLAGRPGAKAEPAAGEVDPEAPRAQLSEAGASLLTEFEADGFGAETAVHQGWVSLATLYALSGREEDMHRILDFAIEAGADADSVLGVLYWLPTAKQLAAMEALLDRNPGAEWSDSTIAHRYKEFGALDKAVAIARRAMEADAEYGPNWGLLDLLCEGDADGAAGFLLSLARANTWAADSLEYVADKLSEHELGAAGLPFVLMGLELDPTSSGLLTSLANIDKQEAIRWAELRVRRNPRDSEAWGKIGEWRLEDGDVESAFEAFAAAVKYEPRSEWLFELMKMDAARALPLISKTTAGVLDDEAIGMLAKTMMRTGDRKGALEVYMRAHQRDPGDVEWLQGMVRLDPQTALDVLAPRVTPSPESADDDMVGTYAKALLALGQTEKAWEYFHHAHEHDSEDAEWRLYLARVDPRRALPILEADYTEDSTNAAMLGPLGVAYAATGQATKARRLIEAAIKNDDSKAKWYRELGKIDPGLAESRLKEAIANESEDANSYASLGYVYLDQGRRNEAREAFEQALSLSDNYQWRLEMTLLGGS